MTYGLIVVEVANYLQADGRNPPLITPTFSPSLPRHVEALTDKFARSRLTLRKMNGLRKTVNSL